MRVRAGRELDVIDISSTGALVEGEARLLPGRHLDVHVVSSTGRTLARSRVVRAFVSALTSDRVLYRGALAFEQSLSLGPPPGGISLPLTDGKGNNLPSLTLTLSSPRGSDYPAQANEWQAAFESTTSGEIKEER
jgi:hypothetical protein